MELNELVRSFESQRDLHIVHSLPILHNSQFQILHINQKLRHVEELRNQLPHIRHLVHRLFITLHDRRKQPVSHIKLPSLQLLGCLSVGLDPEQELDHDGEVGVVEPKVILVVDGLEVLGIVIDLLESLLSLFGAQAAHVLTEVSVVLF